MPELTRCRPCARIDFLSHQTARQIPRKLPRISIWGVPSLMGHRGRIPKPTALKVLEGNPGHRPLPKGEPRPTPIAPKCPSWLSADAKTEWKRVAPELERMALLTAIDGAALAAYCEAWAEFKQTGAVIAKEGLTVKTSAGTVVQHPAVGIRHRSMLLIRAFAAEYGFTPASRVRLSNGKEADADERWNGIVR